MKGCRLSAMCDMAVHLPLERELCPFDLAPVTSTAAQMLFGDTVAIALMQVSRCTVPNTTQGMSWLAHHLLGSHGKSLHVLNTQHQSEKTYSVWARKVLLLPGQAVDPGGLCHEPPGGADWEAAHSQGARCDADRVIAAPHWPRCAHHGGEKFCPCRVAILMKSFSRVSCAQCTGQTTSRRQMCRGG